MVFEARSHPDLNNQSTAKIAVAEVEHGGEMATVTTSASAMREPRSVEAVCN
jgi:hypothetical protein